ncbi:MAG: succinate dehydrogenase, hydrophobic membrane anchor protein [Alphaproteobacteria bacterium]|nr:succinate dehydrogenase, hydrophobic membrane anchor protein [Alphaproteobacteria bacterium]
MSEGAFRTPLSRVRGSGAAHGGTEHFIAQRVTAIALLGLALWFAIAAALHIDSFEEAVAFVRDPVNAVGVILLLLVGARHMMIGMQVVIEDYIAKPGTRTLLLIANAFACAAFAAAGIWSVAVINFGWGY